MLPSQYYETERKKKEKDGEDSRSSPYSSMRHRSSSRQSSSSYNLPNLADAPPLGITGVLCVSRTVEIAGRGTLHYTIYRPRLWQQLPTTKTTTAGPLKSKTPPAHLLKLMQPPPPPLIGVAGGPGMPCHYLTPLVHTISDRAVLLYDPMESGQSIISSSNHIEEQKSFLENSVDDLTALIQHAFPEEKLPGFHLYGHSLGGIVVFEYLKRQFKNGRNCCLSVILDSTPVSIAASHASSQELLAEVRRKLIVTALPHTTRPQRTAEYDDDYDSEIDDDDDDASLKAAVHREFRLRHECRVSPVPLPLQQSLTSLQNNNNHKNVQKQHDELHNYLATVTDLDDGDNDNDAAEHQPQRLPPSCILRGQYDFVTESNCHAWTDIFPTSQYITVSNCSHYGLVEQEDLYGGILTAFLRDHDVKENDASNKTLSK